MLMIMTEIEVMIATFHTLLYFGAIDGKTCIHNAIIPSKGRAANLYANLHKHINTYDNINNIKMFE